MGFIEEEEEQEAFDDWFKSSSQHTTLGRPFEEVRIYMTDKGFGQRRWCYTDMKGELQLTKIKEVENKPLVLLKLIGTDSIGAKRDVVFEYELPLNFKFEGDLT